MHLFKKNDLFNLDYIKNKQNKPLIKNQSPKHVKELYQSDSIQQTQRDKSRECLNLQRKINKSKEIKFSHSIKKKQSKKIVAGQNFQRNIDYGIFNQYRLDQFFDIQKNLDEGSLLSVVSVGSHALHLEEKFLNFVQKYNEFQLLFVGVYGPKGSGKSLFFDKILNLATFQGSQFTQPKIPKSKRQISLWTVPISRGKQKIFLVDCTGYIMSKDSSRQDDMLLDFLNFLCSEIIIVQPLNDHENKVVSESYQLFKASMGRMHCNKMFASRDSYYWPANFSLAYRNQEEPHQNPFRKIFIRANYKKLGDIKDPRIEQSVLNDELKQVFLTKYADRKKKILNQSYFQCASEYTSQFYEQCYPKFYDQVKPNGNALATLLMNFVLSMNCKQKVNICSVVEMTRTEILTETYNATVRWYTRQLEKQLKGQEPKSNTELLAIFDKIFFRTFKYFNKSYRTSLITDRSNTRLLSQIQQLQEKLEKYIREKEILIKKVNEKKNSKYLKQIIDKKIDIKQMPMLEVLELRQILYRSKTIERKLDVNRLECLKGKMIEGWNKFIINQENKHKEQVSRLEQILQTKKQQLKKLNEKNYTIKLRATQALENYRNMNRQSYNVVSKVENLKFQINIHKRNNKEKLQNSYQKIHMIYNNEQELLDQLKQYERKLLKRNKEKSEQLKQLKEQLQEAYKIETQEIKQIQSPTFSNPALKSNVSLNYLNTNLNKNPVSVNQMVSKEKIMSANNFQEAQQASFFSKNEQQVPNALLSSRIARNTESIRLLKNQIDHKSKTEQQLQQKISSSYTNLSRINAGYKNNIIRGSQSRKIQIQKSDKKQTLQQGKSPKKGQRQRQNVGLFKQ